MNPNQAKHHRALELDKVLARLAEFAACADAKQLALDLQPETNLALAQALLNQTRDAHMLLARFGGPSFGGLKNVDNALARANAGSVLSMKLLLDIAEVLRVIRSLTQWRSSNAGVETVLDILFQTLEPNKFLENAITTAIISEEEMADNASPALYDIRRKIRVQESRVREQLEKITHSQKYAKFLQESIITQRGGRYVVPVKNEFRAEVPGLIHDSSASGATVFIEPMAVVEANNEVNVLKAKERDEIERILAELSVQAGAFHESIKASYECAVELSLVFAKANFAYSLKATLPALNDKGDILLRGARHPLIDPKKAVPIDIHLGAEFDTLVITGPNTGGKTVSIKTVGLLSLMAMCGLMLPVNDRSRVSVFDAVFADIGDEQSIEQSLSTFSSHMVNIVEILKHADENSLVLVDELGAGTDPVEGAALATAILETLHFQGTKVAATTHYAELKAYALETPRVENACCEFDVATLRPTYKLLIGVPGRSNALAISARLGMDSAVIETAKGFIQNDNRRFEDVVDKLEHSRKRMEDEFDRAAGLAREAEAAKEEAAKLREEMRSLREKESEAAKAQAAKLMEQAKRESYRLLQELEDIRKEKSNTKDANELARRARAAVKRGVSALDAADPALLEQEIDENYTLPRALVPGDTVMIAGLGTKATVLSPCDRNNMVEVQAGAAKTRVKLGNLRLIEKPGQNKPAPSPRKSGGVESRAAMSSETRVDLRGMTVDDCLLTLDRCIDSALRTGLHEFVIVHGKGTGALRAAVQQYLRKCPYVKSHRLGTFGEGEDGVSIVELK